MKSYNTLPDGYKEIYKLDMQKDKKLSFWLNFAASFVAVIMMVAPYFFADSPFDMPFWTWCMILGLMVVYTVLHELVHGITMKAVGTKKVKYGFTGLYAFAGSNDYYDKTAYITIALAPVIVWGIVLAVIQCFTPTAWFWVPWLIQVTNISGAAGDAYVTAKFSKMPKDILVSDYGVGMTVYSKEEWSPKK